MVDVSQLYPQPQQQQPGLLSGDPSRMLALAQAARQFRSQQAINEAYRGAIGDDGTFDSNKLERLLKGDQNITLGLPQAQTDLLAQQGQQTANSMHAFDLQTSQNNFVQQWLASRASQNTVTPDELRNDAATMSRNTDPRLLPSSIISNTINGLINDPSGPTAAVKNMQNRVAGAANVMQRVTGPPGPGGTPQSVPIGAAPAGAMATGLPPGVGEAAKEAGAGSGQLLTQDRVNAANYRQQVNPLEQAIPALERLGKTGTGPGTEELNHIKSFLQSTGMPGFDVNKIKDFDDAKKYLTDWVNQNGTGVTNDKLAALFAGSPSVNISNAAAVDVAKTAFALKRMNQAKILTFDQSGQPESGYAKWAADWNTKQDQRAYGYDMMPPDAQKKLLSSMKAGSPEYQKFMNSLRIAHTNGLLTAPAQ